VGFAQRTVAVVFGLAMIVHARVWSLPPQSISNPASGQTGTASVTGRVFDGNGPAPVPFASVTLKGSTRSQTIVASEDGAFTFEGIGAGSYFLAATKPGFVTGYLRGASPGQPGPPLILIGGQRLDGLALRLTRGGVITGHIVDQHGEPAIGVGLMVRRVGGPLVAPPIYETWRQFGTDGQGAFRIYGLAPADYLVGVDPSTFGETHLVSTTGPSVSFAPVFYPGVRDPLQAVPVSVAAGEERAHIDLKLQLMELRTVEATIQRPIGTLDYLLATLRPARPDTGESPFYSTTLPDDRMRFSNVPSGEYWLTAKLQPSSASATPMLWALAPITVESRDVSGIVLTLQPAVTVAGRILPSPEDSNGNIDVAKLRASLVPMAGPADILDGGTGARVEGSGRFSVANVIPGRYRLTVGFDADHASWRVVSVTIGGRDVTDGFDVGTGANLSDVAVTIRPGK
jgi:hypothetical protein